MNTAATHTEQLAKIGKFLDDLIHDLRLKNDAGLSRALEVAPPVISKTRSGRLQVGLMLLVRIHDASGRPLSEIREGLGLAPLVPRCAAV